jgi:hypothetical protein
MQNENGVNDESRLPDGIRDSFFEQSLIQYFAFSVLKAGSPLTGSLRFTKMQTDDPSAQKAGICRSRYTIKGCVSRHDIFQ